MPPHRPGETGDPVKPQHLLRRIEQAARKPQASPGWCESRVRKYMINHPTSDCRFISLTMPVIWDRWDESHPPETGSIKYAIKYAHMGPESLWTHPIQRQKLFSRNYAKIRVKMSEGIDGRVGLTINHMFALTSFNNPDMGIYIAKMIWMIYILHRPSNLGPCQPRKNISIIYRQIQYIDLSENW